MAKQTVNIGSSVNKGDGDPLRTAFDKINDNFDELYAATTLDLDSIGSNMIPTTNGVYALGSASKQWSDLYVKDFVYIGNARLQADAQGNLVVNGASIKLDGDVTGSIFGDDSTLLVDGVNNKIVGTVDANILRTGALVVTGTSINFASTTGSIGLTSVGTTSISGAGTVTLTSSGGQVDITANSKINMSASEIDVLTGIVVRNGITGDVTGSVFGDDSSLLVDGVNNKIVGSAEPTSFKAPMLTQAAIDALTVAEGLFVYNTTTGKFQGYAADANNDSTAGWADLH
jgi:hypothetical protein